MYNGYVNQRFGHCGGHWEKKKRRHDRSGKSKCLKWSLLFHTNAFSLLEKFKLQWQHQRCTSEESAGTARWFKWERRAYAKTTCVTAISKQWICGKVGRTLTFFFFSEHRQCVKEGAQLAPLSCQAQDTLGLRCSKYYEPQQDVAAMPQRLF